MKTLKFKRNSWHHRLAKLGGPTWFDEDSVDICSYFRWVLAGVFWYFLITCMCSLLAYSVIDLGMVMAIYFQFGQLFLDGPAIVPLIVTIMLLIAFMVTVAWNFIFGLFKRSYNEPDGFIVHAYKSVKNKYCVKVDIV